MIYKKPEAWMLDAITEGQYACDVCTTEMGPGDSLFGIDVYHLCPTCISFWSKIKDGPMARYMAMSLLSGFATVIETFGWEGQETETIPTAYINYLGRIAEEHGLPFLWGPERTWTHEEIVHGLVASKHAI